MRTRLSADDVIRILELQPLASEGGWYRETYRSPVRIVPGPRGYPSDRVLSTAIHYLLTDESYSALHRLRSDEVYYFHAGDAVELVQIREGGSIQRTTLGPDIEGGEVFQAAVAAGTWQGSRLVRGGQWALLSTSVSPGFEFEDFELADETATRDWSESARSLAAQFMTR